ncbi:MAG: GyrI-like domain-containing protein [Gammaproteobacteria bacterium]|nr:GyrI-like domain-containing protein [Gammaproteobacteria bacterium]
MPTPTIERRELTAQPMLFIRRRVEREAIAQAIGECLGRIAAHCQQAGLAFAGPPFARYPAAGPGLVTIEIGMPLAAAAAGDGEIEAGELQGGPAAFAVHAGPYDRLGETYTALERWIEERGARPGGAPWESYVTDPGEVPDPEDWRTEVYWPVTE